MTSDPPTPYIPQALKPSPTTPLRRQNLSASRVPKTPSPKPSATPSGPRYPSEPPRPQSSPCPQKPSVIKSSPAFRDPPTVLRDPRSSEPPPVLRDHLVITDSPVIRAPLPQRTPHRPQSPSRTPSTVPDAGRENPAYPPPITRNACHCFNYNLGTGNLTGRLQAAIAGRTGSKTEARHSACADVEVVACTLARKP